jgi:hypothetical protein
MNQVSLLAEDGENVKKEFVCLPGLSPSRNTCSFGRCTAEGGHDF